MGVGPENRGVREATRATGGVDGEGIAAEQVAGAARGRQGMLRVDETAWCRGRGLGGGGGGQGPDEGVQVAPVQQPAVRRVDDDVVPLHAILLDQHAIGGARRLGERIDGLLHVDRAHEAVGFEEDGVVLERDDTGGIADIGVPGGGDRRLLRRQAERGLRWESREDIPLDAEDPALCVEVHAERRREDRDSPHPLPVVTVGHARVLVGVAGQGLEVIDFSAGESPQVAVALQEATRDDIGIRRRGRRQRPVGVHGPYGPAGGVGGQAQPGGSRSLERLGRGLSRAARLIPRTFNPDAAGGIVVRQGAGLRLHRKHRSERGCQANGDEQELPDSWVRSSALEPSPPGTNIHGPHLNLPTGRLGDGADAHPAGHPACASWGEALEETLNGHPAENLGGGVEPLAD